jgi:iron only hydrogenase large subunit-like protein
MVLRGTRGKVLYSEDAKLPLRRSHDNTEIKEIYKDFLVEPLSHKSHELLHTTYINRRNKK